MKKIITKIGIATLLSAPLMSLAQIGAVTTLPSQTNNLNDLARVAMYYLNFAIYFIMALAIIMFTWNIYKYFIAGSDDVGKKKEAGLYVMWSIIGFFVILSFWGIVNILGGTLRLNNNAPSTMFGSYGGSSSVGTGAFGGATGGTPILGGTTGGTPILGGSTGGTPAAGGTTGGTQPVGLIRGIGQSIGGFFSSLW